MNNNTWQRLGPNWVKSLRGFSIRRKDRYLLLYEDTDLDLEIEVDPGSNFNLFYLTSAAEKKKISTIKMEEIRKNIADAISFLGWQDKII